MRSLLSNQIGPYRKVFSIDRRVLLIAVIGLVPAWIVTGALVQSHKTYRTHLAVEWSDRGEAALARRDLSGAIDDFRAAARLVPQSISTELRLAAVLVSAHRLDDAHRELAAVRDANPKDGSVNLALARVAVERHDTAAAISYYQAAINGTWAGDAFDERQAAEREMRALQRPMR